VLLLAQTESSGGGGTSLIIYVLLFGVVFYFMMIRPQRNRLRQQQSLARGLEVGDQVRTVGGVLGVVVGVQQDAVVLGIEEGRVRVAIGAIAAKIEPPSDDDDIPS
jgi:preprotein translocase subunit YajC